MKIAAIYARVSSDQQKDDNTIASQTAALMAYAQSHGFSVADDLIFEDEGYSGANLERPGLERIRDLAAEGQLHAVLVYPKIRSWPLVSANFNGLVRALVVRFWLYFRPGVSREEVLGASHAGTLQVPGQE